MSSSKSAQEWLGSFFDYFYRFHPVSATFIGVHDDDYALPPSLVSGEYNTQIAVVGQLLHSVKRIQHRPAGSIEELDLLLAESFLRCEMAEIKNVHFRNNPCTYTGEAVFGFVSLFLRDFAPIDQRLTAAASRLRQVPALLAHGADAARTAPSAWVERTITECDGALKLLRDGLPILLARSDADHSEIEDAAGEAIDAFVAYRAALEGRAGTVDAGNYAIGEAEFDRLLKDQHFLDMTGSQIAAYARGVLESTSESLQQAIAETEYADWSAVADELAALHPSADGYLDRFQQVWDDARQDAVHRELLSWPDFPITFEPIPDWARSAAPHLYFLFYRCPPAFDDGQVQRYLVPPIDHLEPAQQGALLRTVNDAQIAMNHVIHHAGIGHHVQNWHAARAASQVGRITGNDCSMRIAMSSGGTFVEGWACYATDLMEEVGFLTALQRLSMLHSRMRMAARAIVDVELHSGRFSFDDAVAFYVREAGMSEGAAHSEVVKNSMFPTMAMMYLIGTDLIHDLRGEMQQRWGDAFSLRRFHDEFLSWGAIPVSLVARMMRGERLEVGGFSPGYPGWSAHVTNHR